MMKMGIGEDENGYIFEIVRTLQDKTLMRTRTLTTNDEQITNLQAHSHNRIIN